MKFSYPVIKKLVPKIKNKARLIEALNLYAFETEDAGGNVFEVSVPPNRYSDAASHLGMAREAAAALKTKFSPPDYDSPANLKNQIPGVEVIEKKICRRYMARYFEGVKVAQSPKWIKEVLRDCGLRPINNVVDVMNYAMLLTGQPLHAFDADRVKGKIAVRRSKKGEKITTLEGAVYDPGKDVLLIADEKGPLALAGIKGGKKAEVIKKTKRIIVESATFHAVNVYKTSRALNLITDSSLRFSHDLNPALAEIGLKTASYLLKKAIPGIKSGGIYDFQSRKPGAGLIELDVDKLNNFIGFSLKPAQVVTYLRRLGFSAVLDKNRSSEKLTVKIPPLRRDIDNFEDLAEEIARLAGYDNLKARPPQVSIRVAEVEEQIIFKDQLRKYLIGFGLGEVFNYSFVSEKDAREDFWDFRAPELANPISAEFRFLRPSLAPRLLKNAEDNFRFSDEVRIFEIGTVFADKHQSKENLRLGIALASKKKETVFELKGLISELLKKTGLTDFFMRDIGRKLEFLEEGGALRIESDHSVLGYLGKAKIRGAVRDKANVGIAEIDIDKLLALVEGERSFEPLPKYPSVMRDISILVSRNYRIGEILEAIQAASVRYIDDVDLIDEYTSEKLGDNRQSLTFRIVFRADNKTLKDEEADRELVKIIKILERKFKAEAR